MMHGLVRRLTVGLTTATLATGALAGAAPAVAAPNSSAYSAARWLDDQLTSGLVVSGYDAGGTWVEYTDYGLSLDVYFALQELGTRPGTQAEIMTAIEPDTGFYIGTGATRYAGATGKLLAAVVAAGLDPATFGPGSLQTELEGLVTDAGDELGRAKDAFDPADPWGGDFSNSIGQSWVVRSLAGTGSTLLDETTAFLLKQQCGAGFFRVSMESANFTCAAGRASGLSTPSVDATAFGIYALLAAEAAGVPDLADDIDEAADWLVRKQADNGAFAEDGVENANSTGLAAAALAKVGRTGAAGTAAAWLRKRQVTDAVAEGTALANDLGAVAFDRAAFAEGKADGILDGTRYEWRRATAQAAVGVDALLPAKRLRVNTRDFAPAGTKVRVRVGGLAPGERYTIRRGARQVATGWANDDGRATARFVVKRVGKVRVTAQGSRPVRIGHTVIRVR